MHFSNAVLAFGACFSQLTVMAQGFAFTAWPKEIHPGQSTTVKWNGASSEPVTIELCRGESTNLHRVKTITAEVSGDDGSFTWVPKDDIEDGDDYALTIKQGDETNYTGHLKVVHDETHIPPAKGPNPSNATTTTLSTARPTHTSAKSLSDDARVVSGKSTVDHEEQTGAASFIGVSVHLALGAVAAVFFFTT
ncbi:hypothetical protein SI65_02344 [Aspergillus cristatus]|uniref:Yeast cell wall synthesis Kre9/Knh1-like N-terminal domain-containing protein n=1 Tax=Aspergillus cristatus TaxID=573508 RepID=A0A1E3BKK9_ASPCR|nr:hypothetical protein SI65_02344 [Aspergillus cristatus]